MKKFKVSITIREISEEDYDFFIEDLEYYFSDITYGIGIIEEVGGEE